MRRHPVRFVAGLVGVTFLAVGAVGFVPGLSDNHAGMTMAGHRSSALLLGFFQISVLHNVVHILFGLGGLLAIRTAASSRAFLITGGFVYLALTVYGSLIEPQSPLNIVPLNYEDNALHLLLGTLMLGLGIGLSGAPARHRELEADPAETVAGYRY